MVLIVRGDLHANKAAGQAAHGAVGLFKKLYKSRNPDYKSWEQAGSQKVVLRVESEQASARGHCVSVRQFYGASDVRVDSLLPP